MKMQKPEYAIAMEMRKEDKELDAKFEALPDIKKWEWLKFATENKPINSINYLRSLVG